MGETPAAFDLRRYFARAGAWAAALLLVSLATPPGRWLWEACTAWLVSGFLHASGHHVVCHGLTMQVEDLPVRRVVALWTAAPVWGVGAACMLAWPARWTQRLGGLLLLLVNTVLVNAVALGWVAQTPAKIGVGEEGAGAAASYEPFVTALRLAYPVAMTVTLCLVLLYWLTRVVPERRPASGVRQAAERLPHVEREETGGNGREP
ncbi:MAG: hypothetical protein HYU66_01335 [Armatimonadetes bacterium]|nr:hypothetical protein [Armatimonadota bacterium]